MISVTKKFFFVVSLMLSVQFLNAQTLNSIYKAGEAGYNCFRIPAIVKSTKNTMLAFAEARVKNCGDAGDIDIVLKRSMDGGKTWSDIILVWNDAENTCGNPAPVVDESTGNIVLVTTWNLGTDHERDIIAQTSKDSRRVYVLNSADDGVTWSAAKEITSTTKKADWTWYATGPCNGIQMREGPHKGRLVIPCDHIEAASKKYYSHSIHSDDGGVSWTLGGTTPMDSVNECTVAELPGGKLMLNMRNYGKLKKFRQVAISDDGGESWKDQHWDMQLPEPICQGSLIWYNYPGKKPMLAFSNPANQKSRSNMTVKLSTNKGKSWKKKVELYAGPSAYSNLVVLPNGNLACFYEAGVAKPYEGIVFEEIDFSRL
ncbi:sialidase family protein [Pollutibacter soli]|uniref:sialidase family protein n=1 Tax=Pollutibacter soli TaxID=3034157 RepID=UPI0030132215